MEDISCEQTDKKQREIDSEQKGEKEFYSQAFELSSYLSSGYDTISSGTDEENLVSLNKEQNQKVQDSHEHLRDQQFTLLKQLQKQKELHMLAHKQTQIKAAEKLSAKLNAKNISDALKNDLN